MATSKSRLALRALPVRHGAREQALKLIERACAASLRLDDVADGEALHDFRVAIRKLRSFLRVYEPHIGLGRKPLKGLRRIARSTNGARDAEVGLIWLDEQHQHVQPRHRSGLAWLTRRLEAEKASAYDRLRGEIPPAWAAEESGLREVLCAPFYDELGAGTFGQVSAELIQATLDELEDQLRRVRDAQDEEHAHNARIQGKKLRYLIEPFKGGLPQAKAALASMKRFQDLFGDFNDAHVMLGRLRKSIREAAAERVGRLFDLTVAGDVDAAALRRARRQDEVAGLLQVARLAAQRKLALFARIEPLFLAGGEPEFGVRVRALIELLRQAPRKTVGPPRPAPEPETGSSGG